MPPSASQSLNAVSTVPKVTMPTSDPGAGCGWGEPCELGDGARAAARRLGCHCHVLKSAVTRGVQARPGTLRFTLG